MMNQYTVMLESEDGNLYQFNCKAECARNAIVMAEDTIKEKGWDKYNYKTIDVSLSKETEVVKYVNTNTVLDMIGMNDE